MSISKIDLSHLPPGTGVIIYSASYDSVNEEIQKLNEVEKLSVDKSVPQILTLNLLAQSQIDSVKITNDLIKHGYSTDKPTKVSRGWLCAPYKQIDHSIIKKEIAFAKQFASANACEFLQWSLTYQFKGSLVVAGVVLPDEDLVPLMKLRRIISNQTRPRDFHCTIECPDKKSAKYFNNIFRRDNFLTTIEKDGHYQLVRANKSIPFSTLQELLEYLFAEATKQKCRLSDWYIEAMPK